MEKKKIIRCPFCGAEYLAEEIFYPQEVFNKDINITKDESNHILVVNGNSLNLLEEYECDFCGHLFEIKGDVKFSTTLVEPKKDSFDDGWSEADFKI